MRLTSASASSPSSPTKQQSPQGYPSLRTRSDTFGSSSLIDNRLQTRR
jgi:hypothetical protein